MWNDSVRSLTWPARRSLCAAHAGGASGRRRASMLSCRRAPPPPRGAGGGPARERRSARQGRGRRDEGRGGVGGEERACHHQHVLALAPRRRRELSAASLWEWRDRIASFHRCHAGRSAAGAGRRGGGAAAARLGGVAPPPPAVRDAAGLPALVAFLARRCCSERKVTPSSHCWRARLTRHCSHHRRIVNSAVETFTRDLGVLAPRAEGGLSSSCPTAATERWGEDVAAAQQPDAPPHTACGGARGGGGHEGAGAEGGAGGRGNLAPAALRI